MQPGDPDDAVLARFADEAADYLAALGEALLRLETDPAPDVYSDAKRHLHTLKGAASAAGLSAAAHLAHLFEDVMAECQAGRLAHTPALNDVLLRALDTLAAIRLSIFEGGTGQVELSGTLTALESILADGRQVAGLSNDVSQVLSEYQRFRARHAIAAGRTLLEIRLDLERDQFGERVPALESRVAAVADVLARTGASDVPPSADATYLLLVATDDEEVAVRTATELGARVRHVAEHSAEAVAVAPAPAPQAAAAVPPAAAPPPLAGLTPEEAAEIQAEIRALRGEFLESSVEKVAQLAQGLVGLEGRPDDVDLVNGLFRIAHSLKGGGATFGLPVISTVAHALEGVLDEIRCGKRRPTPETVSTLLTGADALQLVIKQPDAVTEQSPEIVTAIGSLKSVIEPSLPPAPAVVPPTAPRLAAGGERTRGSVRVPLHKLDRLINRVNQLSIDQTAVAGERAALDRALADLKRMRRRWERAWTAAQTEGHGTRPAGAIGMHLIESMRSAVLGVEARLASALEELGTLGMRAEAQLDALQNDVMDARMIPIRSVFAGVPRLVRDLARAQHKQVGLTIRGEDTEIDKRILEEFEDPLIHLVRNAVDHGIEPAERRRQVNKPAAGRLVLTAEQAGSQVIIRVEDDGAGIDPARIRETAVRKSLLSPAQATALDDAGARRFIFTPGFSSKETVTEVSGRGVGMDVVMRHMSRLQGSIEVASQAGRGTTFTIRLPLTLAITDVLFVRAAGQLLCFPSVSVVASLQVDLDAVGRLEGRPAIDFRGEVVLLVPLSDVLNLDHGDAPAPGSARRTAIVLSGVGRRVAFAVDEILYGERVLIKSLGPLLPQVVGVSGATMRSSGEIGIILEPSALVAAAEAHRPRAEARSTPRVTPRTVLVVDDSPTTQEMLRGILGAAGYVVEIAADAAEALGVLNERRPHAMIVDVAMPGMDGFELTRRVKADPGLRRIPLIILSALSSDEDRRRGLEAGADAYAVKAGFDRAGLLRQLDALVRPGEGPAP